MPSQEYEQVVAMMREATEGMIGDLSSMSVAEQRAAMEQGAFPLDDDVRVTTVDANGVPGEWVTTPGCDPNRRVLYVHGGGYVMGSLATHRRLCADIARAGGCAVLSLDYRLAPEHPFPAAVDDALAGLEYVWANGPAGAGEGDSVFVAGDSAGGGLTLAALIAARDRGMRQATGGICLSPWTDLAATPEELASEGLNDPTIPDNRVAITASQAWVDLYAGDADRTNPLVSPLYADYAGIPPLLLQTGAVEMICRDTTRLTAKARAAGVDVTEEIWDDMFHVWQAFAPMLPEGQQAIDNIGEWIRGRAG